MIWCEITSAVQCSVKILNVKVNVWSLCEREKNQQLCYFRKALESGRDGQQHGHGREAVRGMRRARGHVRQAHLQRRPRVHREAGPRPDQRHDQGYALRPGPVRRERDERGQLQGDPEPRAAESLHVLHL